MDLLPLATFVRKPRHRGAAALPQRGGDDRARGGGIPPGPAGRDDLRLRQQLHRPDRRGRGGGGRGGPAGRRPGKGNVVRRMFADIEADLYVLADGDLTYDAAAAGRLIDALVTEQVGHGGGRPRGRERRLRPRATVSATGCSNGGHAPVRRRLQRHPVGLPRRLAALRQVVPGLLVGFRDRGRLSVHALDLRLATVEIPLPYRARPEGSASKLSKWRDGARILGKIALMYKRCGPLRFFGALAAVMAAAGLVLGLR